MDKDFATSFWHDAGVSDTEHLIHDVPFPRMIRLVLMGAGLFALCIAPYELWRGVWPPSILTPFFGLIMLGGMSVGGGMVLSAFRTAEQVLVFRPGELEVRETFLRGKRERRFAITSIVTITVCRIEDSEGPDTWEVQIPTTSGETFRSRRAGTEALAQAWAHDFRTALGI